MEKTGVAIHGIHKGWARGGCPSFPPPLCLPCAIVEVRPMRADRLGSLWATCDHVREQAKPRAEPPRVKDTGLTAPRGKQASCDVRSRAYPNVKRKAYSHTCVWVTKVIGWTSATDLSEWASSGNAPQHENGWRASWQCTRSPDQLYLKLARFHVAHDTLCVGMTIVYRANTLSACQSRLARVHAMCQRRWRHMKRHMERHNGIFNENSHLVRPLWRYDVMTLI